jgi:sulfotransferase family protein
MTGTNHGQMRGGAGPPPFPFVVGVARSGTTLVRAILDSHPDMAIPGESHFITEMTRRPSRYEPGDGFRGDRFLHDILGHQRFQRWGLPEERVRRQLRDDPPHDLAAAFRGVYRAYALERGKSRYGDKTPAYVHHIPVLSRLFPEATLVHVVRDGRDVALSHVAHPTFSRTVPEVALVWRRGVERGRRAGRALGPRRYREIRYEDLLDDPEGITRSLCDFLAIDYVSAMLRYHEHADEIIRPTRHPQSHQRIHLPPTKGLRNWRTEMSRRDVAVFDVLVGDLLEELGYERPAEPPTVRARAAARGVHLRAGAGRVAHGVRKRLRLPAGRRSAPARDPMTSKEAGS